MRAGGATGSFKLFFCFFVNLPHYHPPKKLLYILCKSYINSTLNFVLGMVGMVILLFTKKNNI
jgi:hypothetical protein